MRDFSSKSRRYERVPEYIKAIWTASIGFFCVAVLSRISVGICYAARLNTVMRGSAFQALYVIFAFLACLFAVMAFLRPKNKIGQPSPYVHVTLCMLLCVASMLLLDRCYPR